MNTQITQSDRARQIKLKQSLIRMHQEELEHCLKSLAEAKNEPPSQRNPQRQEFVSWMSNHIKWMREEYTRRMEELRNLKREYKAYQYLISTGREFLLQHHIFSNDCNTKVK